jgi:hypothetical protein
MRFVSERMKLDINLKESSTLICRTLWRGIVPWLYAFLYMHSSRIPCVKIISLARNRRIVISAYGVRTQNHARLTVEFRGFFFFFFCFPIFYLAALALCRSNYIQLDQQQGLT